MLDDGTHFPQTSKGNIRKGETFLHIATDKEGEERKRTPSKSSVVTLRIYNVDIICNTSYTPVIIL